MARRSDGEFVGFEVKSFGVTCTWTQDRAEAEKQFNKIRTDAQLVRHYGNSSKSVIDSKLSTFRLMDLVRNYSA